MQPKDNGSGIGFDGPVDYQQAREVLARANYTEAGVFALLGGPPPSSHSPNHLPRFLRRTSGNTPLDTLVRLFVLGAQSDLESTRRALEPVRLEKWAAAGLLEPKGGTVVPLVKLVPHGPLLLVHDPTGNCANGGRSDAVMGFGGSSLTLATMTIRRPFQLTLDLGTGCGIQAFLAARHSERVWAVDRNPRAIKFALFNAQLNRFSNIKFAEGDSFEPVRGRKFDLVVGNPPFVISPESRFLYRDSGMHADDFCRKLVREVPEYLREGGYAQIMCEWPHFAGQDWRERLSSWFEQTGCDVWVLRGQTQDPAAYATQWIWGYQEDNAEGFARAYDQWMAYYDRERIEGISTGLITMRRSSGRPNWFRADSAPGRMVGPCGDHVLHGFEAHDFLETMADDRALLGVRLRISPSVRLEQQCQQSAYGWVPVGGGAVRLIRGLAYSAGIDPCVVGLLGRCDGQRRLRELLAEQATSMGRDLDSIAPAALKAVRELIERGFLLPSNAAG